VKVGKPESDEMDVRGLIWGVWSDGRRRDDALKLKFMLKTSLGRRGWRSFDVHMAGSFFFFLPSGDISSGTCTEVK
jgi:hypothetical protein